MACVELYRAAQLPVFQNRMFPSANAARACTRGDVLLVQDCATGLIFNRAFRPELMVYDQDYQNEQAVSVTFRAHLDEIATLVDRHLAGRSLIEVGCGKGYFLEHLRRCGYAIRGFDPTYEGDDPAIRREYFRPGLGLSADGLILRHVLEHVTDPYDFLCALRDANGGAGLIYIEVPCFDWICHHRAWFDVFYEHVNYFRIADFEAMFGDVHEAGHAFGGQYLTVVADLASLRPPRRSDGDYGGVPADFTAKIDDYAERIRSQRDNGGQKAVVWGGASKGVIFSLFMERAGAPVDCVVDINPAKQGRFLAATGLEVSTPEAMMAVTPPGATVFVMNGNYLDEIRQMTGNQYQYLTVDHD